MASDPTFLSVDAGRMGERGQLDLLSDMMFGVSKFRFFVNGIEYPFVAEIDTERGYADVLDGTPVVKHRLWGNCEIHVVNP